MRYIKPLLLALCILTLIASAQAITLKTLSVNVDASGNADVDLDYELTFVEEMSVYLQIADLKGEVQNALNGNLVKPTAVVNNIDNKHADIYIREFATVYPAFDQHEVIVTPYFSLLRAQEVMDSYWFAPLISTDFSPETIVITFPDGYSEYYYNTHTIPPITRSI